MESKTLDVEALRFVEINNAATSPQLRVVRDQLRRRVQAGWLDSYDIRPFQSLVRESCTLLNLEFESVAEDCNTVGLPNLSLRLEFIISFYSQLVYTLRDKCNQYFENEERTLAKVRSNYKQPSICDMCSRNLRLQHMRVLEKPCITATTDSDEIQRLQSEHERKQQQMEELLKEDLCPAGMESYYHNLKNLVEEKEFYLKKSASQASDKLAEILRTLTDRQDDYLRMEIKTNAAFSSEERLETVKRLSKDMQAGVRMFIEKQMRGILAKYASILTTIRIGEARQRMVSEGVQTDDWRTMENIRQLEVRNMYLLRTFGEQRQRFLMKERQLMEYSQRCENQARTIDRLQVELARKDQLQSKNQEEMAQYQQLNSTLNSRLQQKDAELATVKEELNETKAVLYSSQSVISQLQQAIKKSKEKSKVDSFVQTEYRGKVAATQTDKEKDAERRVMFSNEKQKGPIPPTTDKGGLPTQQRLLPRKSQLKKRELEALKQNEGYNARKRQEHTTQNFAGLTKQAQKVKRESQVSLNARKSVRQKTYVSIQSQFTEKSQLSKQAASLARSSLENFDEQDQTQQAHNPKIGNKTRISELKSSQKEETHEEHMKRSTYFRASENVNNIAGTLKQLEKVHSTSNIAIETAYKLKTEIETHEKKRQSDPVQNLSVQKPARKGNETLDNVDHHSNCSSSHSLQRLDGYNQDKRFLKQVKPTLIKERFTHFRRLKTVQLQPVATNQEQSDQNINNQLSMGRIRKSQRSSKQITAYDFCSQLIDLICKDIPEGYLRGAAQSRISGFLNSLKGSEPEESVIDPAAKALKQLLANISKVSSC